MLEKENKAIAHEMQNVKKLYRTSLQVSLMKDLKIQQMENLLKEKSITFSTDDYNKGHFDRFKKIFTELELASLRGLDFKTSTDSTFLRYCMKALYKQDLSVILKKTLNGTKKRIFLSEGQIITIPEKEPISPPKKVILRNIFDERIDAVPNLSFREKDQRLKNFNIVLAKVIDRLCVDDLRSPRAKRRIFQ